MEQRFAPVGEEACGRYLNQFCYDSRQYSCFPTGIICKKDESACGNVCYHPSDYYCVDDVLRQRGVCTVEVHQKGFETTSSTVIGYRVEDDGNSARNDPVVDDQGGLRLIPCRNTSAGSWFYPLEVCSSDNIYVRFVWSFDDNCTSRDIGDGIAFVMQNVSNIAIGGNGNRLGLEGVCIWVDS